MDKFEQKWFVDGVASGQARLLCEGEHFHLPLQILPSGVSEGDRLVISVEGSPKETVDSLQSDIFD